jgi:hypothetical protein
MHLLRGIWNVSNKLTDFLTQSVKRGLWTSMNLQLEDYEFGTHLFRVEDFLISMGFGLGQLPITHVPWCKNIS